MKKFTKLAAIVAALCLGVCLLAGCSGNSDSAADKPEPAANATSAEDAQNAAADPGADPTEKPTLIVGFDAAYPPYGFMGDDGNYVGFDLDLAAEVAERNNWDLKLEPIDWDAKDALLGQGTINCIWNGFSVEGREGKYTFSEPYMRNGQVVLVRADSDIKNLDDLAGKNVITQVDSAALEILQTPEAEGGKKELADSFATGQPQQLGDFTSAVMQLESGAVDAVACDLSIAQNAMAQKPDVFVVLDEPLAADNYAVGFKLGEDEMAKKVTDTLKEMYKDGTIQKLCEKWGEYGITIDNWLLTD